jgi:hypothetical protein
MDRTQLAPTVNLSTSGFNEMPRAAGPMDDILSRIIILNETANRLTADLYCLSDELGLPHIPVPTEPGSKISGPEEAPIGFIPRITDTLIFAQQTMRQLEGAVDRIKQVM